MTGRPALSHSNSSTSLAHPMSYLSLDNTTPNPESLPGNTPVDSKTPDLRNMLFQVVEWLQEEKAKRKKRKHHRHHDLHLSHHTKTHTDQSDDAFPNGHDGNFDPDAELSLEKLENILSGFTGTTSQLGSKLSHKSSATTLRRASIAKKYKQHRGSVAASSDTEFFGDDILVPTVEAYLDNSKTMAFTGGTGQVDTSETAKRRDLDHWVRFKQDIVRLTHTLKLKGWRRIPIDRAEDIDVVRLSGALTNAVYVVNPPKNMADFDQQKSTDSSGAPEPTLKRRPLSLLLRIYGPQADHLIDRAAELGILRRLARKRIGPRLLGCFENGRFEEFLLAKTLTAEDLRVPETSKQIAKRMRELHEGIELLESELAAGPAVFIHWDKWVERCEKVISWLDAQVHQAEKEAKAGVSRRNSVVNLRYVRRGLVCGVEWPVFRRTYEAYRKRLIADCGGMDEIRKMLVFAHNDTQYGNLMRLQPSGTSPLLQPSNHHKQLVVIDFEYASQNMVGLEFANHFTEWCYNYHHPDLSYVCDTRRYPDEKEQYRFVRSYVMHRPQFNPSASGTPKMEGREKTNISDFMLDARTPGGTGLEMDYEKEEREREKNQEDEIQKLLAQTRVWRLANSAMWVAWGIVQAKVPELDELEAKSKKKRVSEKVADKVKHMVGKKDDKTHPKDVHPMSDPATAEDKSIQEDSRNDRPEGRAQEEAHHEGDADVVMESQGAVTATGDAESNAETHPNGAGSEDPTHGPESGSGEETGQEEEPDEFDYLAYSQDRAMFFWGDCIQMGLVKEEDLPAELRRRAKIVPF